MHGRTPAKPRGIWKSAVVITACSHEQSHEALRGGCAPGRQADGEAVSKTSMRLPVAKGGSGWKFRGKQFCPSSRLIGRRTDDTQRSPGPPGEPHPSTYDRIPPSESLLSTAGTTALLVGKQTRPDDCLRL